MCVCGVLISCKCEDRTLKCPAQSLTFYWKFFISVLPGKVKAGRGEDLMQLLLIYLVFFSVSWFVMPFLFLRLTVFPDIAVIFWSICSSLITIRRGWVFKIWLKVPVHSKEWMALEWPNARVDVAKISPMCWPMPHISVIRGPKRAHQLTGRIEIRKREWISSLDFFLLALLRNRRRFCLWDRAMEVKKSIYSWFALRTGPFCVFCVIHFFLILSA